MGVQLDSHAPALVLPLGLAVAGVDLTSTDRGACIFASAIMIHAAKFVTGNLIGPVDT